jgi:hypothetical protein
VNDPNTADWITAIAGAFAAVGTVGALFAALGAVRIEQKERARTDARGFRCWIEHRAEDGRSSVTLLLLIDNGTQETLFDVRARVDAPTILQGSGQTWLRSLMPPTSMPEKMQGLSGLEKFRFDAVSGTGAEATFTSARGIRWHCDSFGRLRPVKPLRRWAPWRVSLALDRESDPWWAIRSRWHFRWLDWSYARADHLPPPWWAVDIRWQRWRAARRDMPIEIPWWNWRKRWRQRAPICADRVSADLCLPWWAIEERWGLCRQNRALLKSWKVEKRELDRQWSSYQKTGRRPDTHQRRRDDTDGLSR